MTFEEFKQEVVISLGGSLVDVELEDEEIRVAFNKAKRTFQQKGNDSYRRGFYRIPVKKGNQCHHIPPSIHTVVKVIRPTFGLVTDDPFSMQSFQEIFGWKNNAVNTGDWLSYDLTMQMMEIWQRYIAHDVQFIHDVHKNEIKFLKAPSMDEYWLIECYHYLEDEEYMDVLWVQNWTIAEAKSILGTAYSKLSQVSGPDGPVSLGGDRLLQESRDEKQQLLEDIVNGVDGSGDSAWEVYLI